MVNELSFIQEKLLFTKQDFAQFTGNAASAGVTLCNYAKLGLIVSVRRNLYCACNLATKTPEADRMQIASALSDSACVSYHSALEYHGMGHQVFFMVYVQSRTRFNDVRFGGLTYKYFRMTCDCGMGNPPYNKSLRVTDLERTLIDCCDRIDLAGGLEELLHCLERKPLVNEKRMLEYLDVMGKTVLFKKVGYVMELAGVGLSQDFFDVCQEKSRHSVSYLTGRSDTHFVAKWRLYVPSGINEMTGEGFDELV